MVKRICHACECTRSHWATNYPTELVLCAACYHRIIYRPLNKKRIQNYRKKYNYENRHTTRAYSKRWIRFQGKHILCDINPRRGVCSNCNRKVGIDIKKTHIHHDIYDPDNPLAHTTELCVACHKRRHNIVNICYACGSTTATRWCPNKPTNLRICYRCSYHVLAKAKTNIPQKIKQKE